MGLTKRKDQPKQFPPTDDCDDPVGAVSENTSSLTTISEWNAYDSDPVEEVVNKGSEVAVEVAESVGGEIDLDDVISEDDVESVAAALTASKWDDDAEEDDASRGGDFDGASSAVLGIAGQMASIGKRKRLA